MGKNSTITVLAFRSDATEPSLCVKVARFPRNNPAVQREYNNLDLLHHRAKSFAYHHAPRPLLQSEISGLALLVQSVIPGRSMEAMVWRARSLKRAVPTERYLDEIRDLLTSFHRETTVHLTIDGVLERVFAEPFKRLQNVGLLHMEQVRFFRKLQDQIDLQKGMICSATLCHGDARTKNVIFLEDRGWGLVDWEFLEDEVFPWFDWIEFVISLGRSVLGKQGQFYDPQVVHKVLWSDGPFSQLVSQYTHLYCEAVDVDSDWVELWLPVYFLNRMGRIQEYQGTQVAEHLSPLLDLSIEMHPNSRQGLWTGLNGLGRGKKNG